MTHRKTNLGQKRKQGLKGEGGKGEGEGEGKRKRPGLLLHVHRFLIPNVLLLDGSLRVVLLRRGRSLLDLLHILDIVLRLRLWLRRRILQRVLLLGRSRLR